MKHRTLVAMVEIEVYDLSDELEHISPTEFRIPIECALNSSENPELMAGTDFMGTLSDVKVTAMEWRDERRPALAVVPK